MEYPESELIDSSRFVFQIETENAGQRLDKFLGRFGADLENPVSRSLISSLISSGDVLVNTKTIKSSYRLRCGDNVVLIIPPPESVDLTPEKVFFEVVYEDIDILVVSKPPNLVVHPACGHYKGTLVHGLLYHCKDLSGINGSIRPGIVHRLDKDTSGLLVVAKNDQAQRSLVSQFKDKTVGKIYMAIVDGCPQMGSGTIVGNIGRHPVNRKKMALLDRGGRESVTHWQVVEKFKRHSLIKLQLETGRTHQIRVHLASIGIPVSGDKVYGGKRQDDLLAIFRQCLHAAQLSFVHPRTKENLEFTVPLWPDIDHTLKILRGE